MKNYFWNHRANPRSEIQIPSESVTVPKLVKRTLINKTKIEPFLPFNASQECQILYDQLGNSCDRLRACRKTHEFKWHILC